jgi:hypothetical protein
MEEMNNLKCVQLNRGQAYSKFEGCGDAVTAKSQPGTHAVVLSELLIKNKVRDCLNVKSSPSRLLP